jgi:hypothetical protein
LLGLDKATQSMIFSKFWSRLIGENSVMEQRQKICHPIYVIASFEGVARQFFERFDKCRLLFSYITALKRNNKSNHGIGVKLFLMRLPAHNKGKRLF